MEILFIYKKDDKIKVLGLEDARITTITSEGWKHLHTVNSALFIENLYNNNELIKDIIDEE